MKIQQCPREHDVVQAVSADVWEATCSSELRAHVADCAICRDVAEVAGALQSEYASVSEAVRVPSAGMVWWRAQLRARREAVRKAERPLKLAHAFGGAAAFGVATGVMAQMSPWFRQMLPVLMQEHLFVSLTLGVLIVAAPVAVYFALSDK